MRNVKNVLMEKANDLWGLCRSNRINKWSKYKPVFYKSKNISDSELTAVWGNSGFVVVRQATTALEGIIDYRIPPDNISAPHRLGDFRGYDHDAEAPFIINPDIIRPVVGGSSGVFEFSFTVKLPAFITELVKEFNNLNQVNLFVNENNTWVFRGSTAVKEGYMDVTDTIEYNNIPNLGTVTKEYLLVFTRYSVAGSGLQDRYNIGSRLTCKASVKAFDGANNAAIELYNFPKWFTDICMGDPVSLAPITHTSTHIRFRAPLRRPLVASEIAYLTDLDCNLYSRDYESPADFALWRAYSAYNRDDYSISWSNDYIQWELNVPANNNFNKFINIRLSAV